MKIIRQILDAANNRYLIYVLAGAAVLYAATSPLIADPILNFMFAGVVPGSDTVLSPSTVLLGTAIISGVLLAAALVVWLLRRTRTAVKPGTRSAVQEQTHPAADALDKLTGEGVIFARAAAHAIKELPVSHNRRAATRKPFSNLLTNAARRAAIMATTIRRAVRRLVKISFKAVVWAVDQYSALVAAAFSLLWILLRTICRYSVSTAGYSARRLRLLWNWAKPHLMEFDTWLELRYRAAAKRTRRMLLKSETYQILDDMIRSGKQLRRRSK